LYYFQEVLESFLDYFFQLTFSAQAHLMVERLGAFTLVINTKIQIFSQLMPPIYQLENQETYFYVLESSFKIVSQQFRAPDGLVKI